MPPGGHCSLDFYQRKIQQAQTFQSRRCRRKEFDVLKGIVLVVMQVKTKRIICVDFFVTRVECLFRTGKRVMRIHEPLANNRTQHPEVERTEAGIGLDGCQIHVLVQRVDHLKNGIVILVAEEILDIVNVHDNGIIKEPLFDQPLLLSTESHRLP